MATMNNDRLIEYLRTTWGKQDPVDVVEEIGKGKYLPLQAFLLAKPQQQNGSDDKEEDYRSRLVQVKSTTY